MEPVRDRVLRAYLRGRLRAGPWSAVNARIRADSGLRARLDAIQLAERRRRRPRPIIVVACATALGLGLGLVLGQLSSQPPGPAVTGDPLALLVARADTLFEEGHWDAAAPLLERAAQSPAYLRGERPHAHTPAFRLTQIRLAKFDLQGALESATWCERSARAEAATNSGVPIGMGLQRCRILRLLDRDREAEAHENGLAAEIGGLPPGVGALEARKQHLSLQIWTAFRSEPAPERLSSLVDSLLDCGRMLTESHLRQGHSLANNAVIDAHETGARAYLMLHLCTGDPRHLDQAAELLAIVVDLPVGPASYLLAAWRADLSARIGILRAIPADTSLESLEAARVLYEAAGRKYGNAPLHRDRGIVLARSGQRDEARSAFQDALRQAATNPDQISLAIGAWLHHLPDDPRREELADRLAGLSSSVSWVTRRLLERWQLDDSAVTPAVACDRYVGTGPVAYERDLESEDQ